MKILRYIFELALACVGILIAASFTSDDLMFYIGIALVYAAYKLETTCRRIEYERKCIDNQILFKGETKKQVLASWGEPDDSFSNSDGVIWCYGPIGSSGSRYKARITFKRGVVSKFTRAQKDF